MKIQAKELREVLESIKKKCKEDCCAGDRISWLECSINTCALYRYRLGYNPKKNDNLMRENKANSENKGILEKG